MFWFLSSLFSHSLVYQPINHAKYYQKGYYKKEKATNYKKSEVKTTIHILILAGCGWLLCLCCVKNKRLQQNPCVAISVSGIDFAHDISGVKKQQIVATAILGTIIPIDFLSLRNLLGSHLKYAVGKH